MFIYIYSVVFKKEIYCVSLTSFSKVVNDIFSFALKPNFLINSIFSFDNGADAVPAVDC